MATWIVRIIDYDERLLRAVIHQRRPLLDRVMRAVTHLADWPIAATVALSLAFGLVPGSEDAGRRAVATLALAHLFVEVLKRVFTRERPQLGTGMAWLVTVPDRFSFPSGHATAAMSIAVPLALSLALPWSLVAIGIAVAVGISRCYLGVHYPGDVAAGWALSLLTLAVVVGILG